MLDMGPFHDQLKMHLECLIANPDLLLDTTTHGNKGHLMRGIWHEPLVFEALKKEQERGFLPHLRKMLIEFCCGALNKWANFTSEFVSDGTIAPLTPAERKDAFMPTTNDANEGMLGTWRVCVKND